MMVLLLLLMVLVCSGHSYCGCCRRTCRMMMVRMVRMVRVMVGVVCGACSHTCMKAGRARMASEVGGAHLVNTHGGRGSRVMMMMMVVRVRMIVRRDHRRVMMVMIMLSIHNTIVRCRNNSRGGHSSGAHCSRSGRHHKLRLASWPIFVVGMFADMLSSQSLCLVNKWPFITFGQLFPLGTQASRYFRVVHLRIFLGHFASLTARPNHKGIHRPLDMLTSNIIVAIRISIDNLCDNCLML